MPVMLSFRRCSFIGKAAGLCTILCSQIALAQPDLTQKASTVLLEQDSAHYMFETLSLSSEDGHRPYRIVMATPKRAVPKAGYPVIYMLDGNAVLDALEEPLLAEVAKWDPPVIVMIGYNTAARFDTTARAYDYTPPVSGEAALEDVPGSGRKAGGADWFLDFIIERLKPAIETRVKIDPRRRSLWGHSYGGLFVLHALFTRPETFQTYFAVSPSLWWHEGFILEEEKIFTKRALRQPVKVVVMAGSDEGKRPSERRPGPASLSTLDAAGEGQETKSRIDARIRLRSSLPSGTTADMVRRLNAKAQVTADYQVFSDLAHGPMLKASIEPTLRMTSGALE